ncbi:MAG TPA: TIGR04084 family radical SAM/SPASM domain-containing protein [Thermoplasmatales archaeon]|nr:TIGR04084 family radical SAM/SPASM domain-containing protein [Candidatus Thermoplasmatota archaeon]HDS58794.1 TIGR04084 family radical SAM/SPASM domain-containing protein [Thermoplasmatales archaeon]
MLYIVMVTAECNLSCRYCGGTLATMPRDITYDLHDLREFIARDREAVVAFYGGEPLLRPRLVQRLLHELPARHFVLQTNGFFMEKLGPDVHRLDAILLSVDGRPAVTDGYRAPGCYRTVMKARDWLHGQEYAGDLIARMAVSRQTDIYADVMHLLQRFPHVHWQLDAVWSALWGLQEFKEWARLSYLPGIERLVREWAACIEQGTVPGIVPFLGIMQRMLWGGSGLPCGAGSSAVAIATDGRVIACPVAGELAWNEMGNFHRLRQVTIGEPCTSCDLYPLCGGRCLFAYKERLWGEEGFDALCAVTRHLVEQLAGVRGVVEDALPGLEKELRYPPFNNTTEVIP